MGQPFVFFNQIGATVCHRLPERSFFLGGRQMPLCARCTGLYTGVFLAFCYFLWKHRQDGDTPFPTPTAALTVLALLPIAADGFGSYIGLWESTPLLRVLTGASAGAAMPALFLLAGNFQPARKPALPVYAKTRELPFLLGLSLLWGLFLWLSLPPYIVGAVFSAAGVFLFWAGVAYVLLRGMLPKKRLPFWLLSAAMAACFLYLMQKPR